MSITGRGRFNIVATDEYGNIAPGASVEIRTEPGLTLTSLFTNRDGTGARANPLTADENGYAFAYAPTGHYQIKLSVYGRERILRDVEIGVTYSPPREPLTANRTYFVRTDGNNSNSGLVNNAGGAFLTIARAFTAVAGLDLGIYDVTIQLGNGTHSGGGVVTADWVGSGSVTIRGNAANPASVVVSGTATLFDLTAGRLDVANFTVTTTTGSAFLLSGGAFLTLGAGMRFGSVGYAHVQCTSGARVLSRSAYTIFGGGQHHIAIFDGGFVDVGSNTVTLTGTPAFSASYALVVRLGLLRMVNTIFTGAATGKRHDVQTNSIATTFGLTFPGDVAGTEASGGIYA